MKKVLGLIIIVILILAVIWLVYEGTKAEPANINASNEVPNEIMGMANIINTLFENEVTNEVANETVNEVVEENTNQVTEPEEDNTDETDSEVISGTATSREEKAVEIAKEYYAKEYGSTDEINFDNQGVYGDGRYIVRAGNAGRGINMFLLVDLDTGEVTER